MADRAKKISELTELTTVAGVDLLLIVDDPSGTPATKKITVDNFTKSLSSNNIVANNIITNNSNVTTRVSVGNTSVNTIITPVSININNQLIKPVSAPETSLGQIGDEQGMTAFDSEYFYYCTASYDGETNIWKRIAWSNDIWS